MSQSIQSDTQGHKITVERLQREVASTKSQIDRVHGDVVGISRTLDSVGDRTYRIEANFEASHANIRREQMHIQDTLQSSIKECDAARKEVSQLRDNFMQWITGNNERFSSLPEPFSNLDETTKSNLSLCLVSKLTETPSTLKSACENISYSLRMKRKAITADWSTNRCICVPMSDRWIISKGGLSFEYESLSQHCPRCWIHRNQKNAPEVHPGSSTSTSYPEDTCCNH